MVPDMVEVRPTNLSEEISTMTTPTMALTELADKGADIDVLGQVVQFMAQRLMELDVEDAAAPATTRRIRLNASTAATATASEPGTPEPAASS